MASLAAMLPHGSIAVPGTTYRHKGVAAVGEVQRSKHQAGQASPVALHPAARQQIPLGLELATQLAAEASVHGRQQDCSGVVPRSGSQLLVLSIVELDGVRRECFGVEVREAVGGELGRERGAGPAEGRNEKR